MGTRRLRSRLILIIAAWMWTQPAWAGPEFSPSLVGMYRKSMQIEAPLFSAADLYGLDPRLARALILYQSGGNDVIVSASGELRRNAYLPVASEPASAGTAEANLEAGIRRFAELAERLQRHDYALAAYIAGPQVLASQPALPLSVLHDVMQIEQYKSVLRLHEAEIRREAEGLRLRRVQPGENWASVARTAGVSEFLLRLYNPVLAAHQLHPGMLLVAPDPRAPAVLEVNGTTLSYTSRIGDSTLNLARAFGVDRDALRQDNNLWYLQQLAVGQPLSIHVADDSPSSPVRLAASAPGAGIQPHTVRAGETLSHIALRYGTSVRTLMRTNRLSNSRIVVGQQLWIPDRRTQPRVAQRPRLHTVRRGDTLSHLAQRYDTSVRALMRVNRLGSSRLRIGKILRIPDQV